VLALHLHNFTSWHRRSHWFSHTKAISGRPDTPAMVPYFYHCHFPAFFEFQLAFEYRGNISVIEDSANAGKNMFPLIVSDGNTPHSTVRRWLPLRRGFMKGVACHGKGSRH
jgi:hypothetical protein